MFKIALVDDNPIILEKFNLIFQEIQLEQKCEVEISKFSSGESLLYFLSSREDSYFDLFVIDVVMEALSGLETAMQVQRIQLKPNIVFLSSGDENMFNSFEIKPIAYMLKSEATKLKLSDVFLKAFSNIKENESKRNILIEGMPMDKNILEAIYIEKKEELKAIFSHDQYCLDIDWTTLKKIVLKGDFILLRKDLLLNICYVEKIDSQRVFLSDFKELSIHEGEEATIKKALTEFLTASV